MDALGRVGARLWGHACSGARVARWCTDAASHIHIPTHPHTHPCPSTACIVHRQVLSTKDWRVWDWEVISSLLDGPLATSAAYFAEAMRGKFFKRLCGFFRTELGPKGCVGVGE